MPKKNKFMHEIMPVHSFMDWPVWFSCLTLKHHLEYSIYTIVNLFICFARIHDSKIHVRDFYSGRNDRQNNNDIRQQPSVSRIPSRRQPTRSKSDSRLNGRWIWPHTCSLQILVSRSERMYVDSKINTHVVDLSEHV